MEECKHYHEYNSEMKVAELKALVKSKMKGQAVVTASRNLATNVPDTPSRTSTNPLMQIAYNFVSTDASSLSPISRPSSSSYKTISVNHLQ